MSTSRALSHTLALLQRVELEPLLETLSANIGGVRQDLHGLHSGRVPDPTANAALSPSPALRDLRTLQRAVEQAYNAAQAIAKVQGRWSTPEGCCEWCWRFGVRRPIDRRGTGQPYYAHHCRKCGSKIALGKPPTEDEVLRRSA